MMDVSPVLTGPCYSVLQETEVEPYDFPDQIKLRDDRPASSDDSCSC